MLLFSDGFNEVDFAFFDEPQKRREQRGRREEAIPAVSYANAHCKGHILIRVNNRSTL
jgi:hypothetical protein